MSIGCNFDDDMYFVDKRDYHFNWLSSEDKDLLKEHMPCYENCRLCKGELKEVLAELKQRRENDL